MIRSPVAPETRKQLILFMGSLNQAIAQDHTVRICSGMSGDASEGEGARELCIFPSLTLRIAMGNTTYFFNTILHWRHESSYTQRIFRTNLRRYAARGKINGVRHVIARSSIVHSHPRCEKCEANGLRRMLAIRQPPPDDKAMRLRGNLTSFHRRR